MTMNANEVHDRWATRSGAYSPEYYAYYGPNATSNAIRRTLDRVVDRDAAVLELGCSSGRHLAHLHEHGYENLFGIDINETAFEVMHQHSPDLFEAGTFYCCPIESLVRDAVANRFDVVYSVETLQHVHPENEWVFDELTQLAGTLLLTAENEGDRMADRAEQSNEGDGATDTATITVTESGSATRDDGNTAVGPRAGVDATVSQRDGDDADERPRNETAADDTHEKSAANDARDGGGVPLYVRDWNRIFTELGLVEVESESTEIDRYTLRAFRAASAHR